MDLEHAIEIAEESRTGGYDSPTEQALQFLAEYARNAIIEKRAAEIVADRKALDSMKDIATIDYNGQALELKYFADRTESQTLERALLSAERTLRRVDEAIRATIKEDK